jgi:hypothetical protein
VTWSRAEVSEIRSSFAAIQNPTSNHLRPKSLVYVVASSFACNKFCAPCSFAASRSVRGIHGPSASLEIYFEWRRDQPLGREVGWVGQWHCWHTTALQMWLSGTDKMPLTSDERLSNATLQTCLSCRKSSTSFKHAITKQRVELISFLII